VCHFRILNAFRILLEDRHDDYEQICNEHLPNGAIVWYTRRDPGGCVHDRVYGGKVISVEQDGIAKEVPFAVGQHIYTNEELLEQAQRVPQVVFDP